MGIQSIGKLISYASKTLTCKGVGLVSKPAVTRTLEGEFKLATELIGDTCHFSRIDRSLDLEFVRGLLKIEGKTPLETFTKIKDEILKAKGFKHPEALAIEMSSSPAYMFYDSTFGRILLNTKEFAQVDKKELIECCYHELDHMEKDIKLYKALGEEEFIKLLYSGFEPEIKALIKKDRFESLFNKTFYKTMSKDVNCQNFDIKKYYYPAKEQKMDSWGNMLRYFNDPFEKDAYEIQKKVNGILGGTQETIRDCFIKYNKIYMGLMEKANVPLPKRFNTIEDLKLLVVFKNINENPDNIRKYMKLREASLFKKASYSEEDKIFIKEINEKLSEGFNKEEGTFYLKQIENWMREGKFTVEDVLKDM